MVKIKIGNCKCCFHFDENQFGRYCYKQEAIYLGKFCNETMVFAILNHEFLHYLFNELFDVKIARAFDCLFRESRFGKIIYDSDNLGLPIR